MRQRLAVLTLALVLTGAATFPGCARLKQTAGEALMVGAFLPITVTGAVVGTPFLLFVPADSDTIPGVREYVFADDDTIIAACAVGRRQLLFRIPMDGSEPVPLTTGDRHDFDLAASPDGRFIVFASAPDARSKRLGRVQIHRLDVGTGATAQLTFDEGEHHHPRVSPDGQWVVYEFEADVYVVPSAGGEPRALSRNPEWHDAFPQFHPDGDRVVFARAAWYGHSSPIATSDWHGWRILEVPLEGGEPKVLRDKCIYRLGLLELSPAGDRAVYQGIRNFWGETHLIQLDGSNAAIDVAPSGGGFDWERIESDDEGAAVIDPSFTPDGAHLLFAAAQYDGEQSLGQEVFRMDLATLTPEALTDLRGQLELDRYEVCAPASSPGGERVAFLLNPSPRTYGRRWELWVVDTGGGAAARLGPLS